MGPVMNMGMPDVGVNEGAVFNIWEWDSKADVGKVECEGNWLV